MTAVVGRGTEREAIDAWLDGERPGSLLIDGEAGIGKSTLWNHAIERASSRDEQVLRWRASVAEQDIAFATLIGLLDQPAIVEILGALPDPRRRALEAALGRVTPDLQPLEPSLVGSAVADVLRILASGRRLVVAIDDLQWVDDASEHALAFAARRLRTEPIGLVLARRTAHSRTAEERSVIERGPIERSFEPASAGSLHGALDARVGITVGPLSVGALGRLIHERLGVAHPRPLLVRLHDACSGNPFVALEISRSLAARTVELSPGEPFPVAAEIGPLVHDHLAGLGRDARRCLLIVAVSADPTMGLVRRILGPAGDQAVDAACRQGVLVADGSRLRAVHPLYASVATADAPPGERRALHAALAEAVDDPVERALHLAASVEGRDAQVAEALRSAGLTASARGAPGIAADLFDHAARLAEAPDVRAADLVAAAEAAVAAGDPELATTRLEAVLEEVPSGPRRAQALLALGDILYVERPNEALPVLISALDHTGGDPNLEAAVHSSIASMADMDPQTGHRSALAAVEILERPGVTADPDHLACALLDRAFHWLLRGERVAWQDIDRGIALMTGAGATPVARRAQELAERCTFHLGRLHEALAFDQAEYRRLSERGQVGLLPPLLQSMSVLALMAGDWDAARRDADACLDLVEQGEEGWRERALTARARILAWQGDLDAARSIGVEALARQEAAGDRWEAAIFCALLGFIELSVPDAPTALGYLTRALEHGDAMEVVLPTQFRFLGDLVEAAVLAGDLELAERVLVERLERPSVRLPLPWIEAMAARGRGFLAGARGASDEATGHFDRAIAIFDDRLPMPFERARALLARGQVQRRAGHRRAAREDIGAALAVFDALGADAWGRRARHELGRIGGRMPVGTGLTVSERAVAEAAAAGRSNREIATELVVSVRTVESQLSAVYRKLDIRSRSQLRAALEAAEPVAPG